MRVEIVDTLGSCEITGITDNTGYLVLTTEKPEFPGRATAIGGINPNIPLYIKHLVSCAVQCDGSGGTT